MDNMNEIDRIRLLNDLSEGEKTLILYRNFSKYWSIRKGEIEYNNSDIDKLIEYFEESNNFIQCSELLKLRK
jgi:hypothetical protein